MDVRNACANSHRHVDVWRQKHLNIHPRTELAGFVLRASPVIVAAGRISFRPRPLQSIRRTIPGSRILLGATPGPPLRAQLQRGCVIRYGTSCTTPRKPASGAPRLLPWDERRSSGPDRRIASGDWSSRNSRRKARRPPRGNDAAPCYVICGCTRGETLPSLQHRFRSH